MGTQAAGAGGSEGGEGLCGVRERPANRQAGTAGRGSLRGHSPQVPVDAEQQTPQQVLGAEAPGEDPVHPPLEVAGAHGGHEARADEPLSHF